MNVSIIIPTYNRKQSLIETLNSINDQVFPSQDFETIVIDDGSEDGTEEINSQKFSFSLRYFYHSNKGGVFSRNYGVQFANGDFIIFLDDDMTLMPEYIQSIVEAHDRRKQLITRGKYFPWQSQSSVFTNTLNKYANESGNAIKLFSSNNLGILRSDFLDIGGWKEVLPPDVSHKGGIWSDLEFAYRASQMGYEFRTVDKARIIHRDYTVQNLKTACKRAEQVSNWAVALLNNYPELSEYIPMLEDKKPINWRNDKSSMMIRKLFRKIVSTGISIELMENLTKIIEVYPQNPALLRPLYRWIIGAYIYRGYRQGLRVYGRLGSK